MIRRVPLLLVGALLATSAACSTDSDNRKSAPAPSNPTGATSPTNTAEPTIASACFTATGPDGKPYSVYGKRFTVGNPSPSTPAIVLVHGVASNTDVWDLTPRASVARSLARAGYVVLAYDRLGYRNSNYNGAGGPNALTIAAQQSVLHDLIGQVHDGSYQVGAADATCSMSNPATTSYGSEKVAIIGHSAGGFLVSSYPGRYHDVAAMVQANAPSGLNSTNPPGNAALVSAGGPPPKGAMVDTFGPVGDPAQDADPPAAAAGYAYAPGPARSACEEFTLWRPGAVKDVATVMCNPANSTGTPKGETDSLVAQAGQNNTLIPQTGSVPVLLAAADHDGTMPANANALELSAWKEHCNCDVSQFILPDTGHAFMAHTSLTTWVNNVTTWFSRKGIAAEESAPK